MNWMTNAAIGFKDLHSQKYVIKEFQFTINLTRDDEITKQLWYETHQQLG
jgi:hypothetical protein